MFPNRKVIIAMGLVLTVIGVMLFPFGYDAVFYFVLNAAGGNYALATFWMYSLAIGIGAIGIILTRYAHRRKHFTNKWFVFAIIIIIMVLVLLAIQVGRMVAEGTPPTPP